MKRLLLALLLLSGVAYGQSNNTTNTNFTNGLASSKFFNIPRGTTPPTTGILAGSLFYHTTLGLQYYNGTIWVTVGTSGGDVTSFNGRSGVVVPLVGDYPFFPLYNGTGATGTWGIGITGNAGTVTNGVYTNGTYNNPSWLNELAWSKITSTPTTLAGYGITDAVPNTRSITINGTTQFLSANRTWNVGTVTSVDAVGGTGISVAGVPITSSGTVTITNTAPDQTVVLNAGTGISTSGTYPNFTITNTAPSTTSGTVTSVSALTLGTTGTDLSSSVVNGSSTPVITLNVPTASASNRGALSSADWSTFNSKQAAYPGLQDSISKKANTTFVDAEVLRLQDSISGKANKTFANVKDFGASGNGVTDDSDAIIAAVSSGYQTIYFPEGTYNITKQITINESIELKGDGVGKTKVIIGSYDAGDFPNSSMFYIAGSVTDSVTISADAKVMDQTISLSDPLTLGVNDVIAIVNTDSSSYSGVNSYYKDGEFLTVKTAVTSGNLITVSSQLQSTYPSSTSKVYKYNMLNGVSIHDMEIVGITAGMINTYGIYANYISNSRFYNLKMSGSEAANINILRGYNVEIKGSQLNKNTLNITGRSYGISIGNSQNLTISENVIYATRHAVSVGGVNIGDMPLNRNIRVVNNELDASGVSVAADFHGNVEDSFFINNRINGSISVGGDNNTISGNYITNRVSEPAIYLGELKGSNINISGNTINANHLLSTRASVLFTDFDSYNTRGGTLSFKDNNISINTDSTTNVVVGVDFRNISSTALTSLDISGNIITATDNNQEVRGFYTRKSGGVRFKEVNLKSNSLIKSGIGVIGDANNIDISGNTSLDAQISPLYVQNSDVVFVKNNIIANFGMVATGNTFTQTGVAFSEIDSTTFSENYVHSTQPYYTYSYTVYNNAQIEIGANTGQGASNSKYGFFGTNSIKKIQEYYSTSVASTPTQIGEGALVSGEWYKSTGTSSSADWQKVPTSSDVAYSSGWDGSLNVPTKNAVYDKIQSLSSGMTFKGGWDASTNTPTLADGIGTLGDLYTVTQGGTALGRTYVTGGTAIYDGLIWVSQGTSNAVSSVNGQVGAVALTKTDLSLGNVDNTSDLNKPISTATQSALNLKLDSSTAASTYAPLNGVGASGTWGIGISGTAANSTLWNNRANDLSTSIDTAPNYVLGLDGSTVTKPYSVAALKLFLGLGSNAYTSTAYAPLASPALTGTPTAPTPSPNDNSTKVATTAYVDGAVSSISGANGVFTPTLTNALNVTSSADPHFSYSRVGNTVTVYGSVEVTVTSSSATTELGISLPSGSTSNFTSSTDAFGHGNTSGTGVQSCYVISDSVNDRAVLRFFAASSGLHEFFFSFQYQVLP